MEGDNKPKTEDANLTIELVKLLSSDRKAKAFQWFFKEFVPKNITDYTEYSRLYPMGSEEFGYFEEIQSFFELAGALIKHGVLNENLFFDVAPPTKFFWEHLKPIVYGLRSEMNEQRIGENFELLYEREKKWEDAHPPKTKLA